MVVKCDWERTTRNGVAGYEVSGRGDYSSASIFLPYSVWMREFGYYWSSVPYSDPGQYDIHSKTLYFDSDISSMEVGFCTRDVWSSIRPVQSPAE